MTGYDTSKLVNAVHTPKGIVAQCPACALLSHDLHGKNHLLIRPNGAFGCSVDQSKEHYRTIYRLLHDPNAAPVEFVEPPPRIDDERVYPEDTMNKLLPDYSYWLSRGATEDVLRAIGGGLATKEEKSKLSGRYVFPCRDERGRIVGFAGRLTEPSFGPKWKIIGRKKSFVFPPLSLSRAAIEAKGEVVLVEGIGCVLALAREGIWNTMCLFGLEVSPKQIGLMIGMGVKRVRIATNNEASGIGNAAAAKIRYRLMSFFSDEDVIVQLPIAKDFMEMNSEQMSEWKKRLS